MDSCNDCGFPDAHAQTPLTVTTSSNTSTLQSALDGLDSGATVTFSSGTFTDLGTLDLTKPITLKGTPPDPDGANPEDVQGTVFTGESYLLINADNVTIQDLTFKDLPRKPNTHNHTNPDAVIAMGEGDRINITISSNTMINTFDNGIRIGSHKWPQFVLPQYTLENIHVSDNVLIDIGRNSAQVNNLKTAIRTMSTGVLKDVDISNNIMDNATFAGINLAQIGVINVHVHDNTISNMLAFGIQKAVERRLAPAGITDPAVIATYATTGTKLVGPDSSLWIYNNTITAANNALEYPDGTAEGSPEAAVLIWGHDDADIRVYDNVIRDSHNGVLLCVNSCGVHEDNLGEPVDIFTVADTPIDMYLEVIRNSFINNTGHDLINLAQAQMFAPFNYWDQSPITDRIVGGVLYTPYYTDAERTTITGFTPSASSIPSTSLSSISTTAPACSISTGAPITFNLVTGGESSVTAQTIRNSGSLDITGVQVNTDAWTDAGDNEYSTLTTFVRTGGEFRELTPGQYLSVDSGLSAPASSSALEFKVVHSGRTLPAGEGTLSQTISLFGSCG